MCKPKPGPRCSSHAAGRLAAARKALDADPANPQTQTRVLQAQDDFDSTKAGASRLALLVEQAEEQGDAREAALLAGRLEAARHRRREQVRAYLDMTGETTLTELPGARPQEELTALDEGGELAFSTAGTPKYAAASYKAVREYRDQLAEQTRLLRKSDMESSAKWRAIDKIDRQVEVATAWLDQKAGRLTGLVQVKVAQKGGRFNFSTSSKSTLHRADCPKVVGSRAAQPVDETRAAVWDRDSDGSAFLSTCTACKPRG